MLLETLAILVGVLCHCDEQHHLNIQSCDFRIEYRDAALDKTGILEVTDSPPARRSGHTDKLRELALIARRISLQFAQQQTIRF